MTRKHNTTHAPSLRQLEADPRAAYYQAHHDAREEARNSLGLAAYAAGRARIVASWTWGKCSVLVSRNIDAYTLFFGDVNAAATAALNAEIAAELDRAGAARRQPKTYPADKALARRAIGRARWLRQELEYQHASAT
jgi:hypothetical protein